MSAVDAGARRGAGRAARRVHPARAEAVRGIAPLTGVVVALAPGVPAALFADGWQGSWWETQMTLRQGAALFAAPLAGAAACWQGAREHRRRTLELRATAARSPLAQAVMSAAPGALWTVAGYLAALVGCLLATLPYAGAGGPRAGLVLADAAFLAAVSVIGHVCGTVLPHRLVPPLYGGLLLLVPLLPGPLSPYDVPDSPRLTDAVTVGWYPWAVLGWWGGLALAALLGRAARRRSVALVPLLVAVVAAVPLVRSGERVWRIDPLAQRTVCAPVSVPRICVDALNEEVLPQVVRALSPLGPKLRGVTGVPRLRESPGGAGPEDAVLPDLHPSIALVRGRLVDPAGYLTTVTVELTTPPRACVGPGTDRLGTAGWTVSLWLLPEGLRARELDYQRDSSSGYPQERARLDAREAEVARLDALSGEERRAWLSGYFAARAGCAPGEVPPL
ncbi:hypothetical protein JNUCC64_31840 [Streptomyces sp. JNUCC 64]